MRKDLVLIAVIVATLALMVVPLNQGLIDVLLAVNISLSVLMLMVAVYLKTPSDFSTFPSVILLGTAFRLALSVGTTRLILAEADAGLIIETFGEFVVSGSIVIGLVIFLIITVVQFLVVTKGAERVAEVAARFALDAMPGKQMSIDAEVRAGNMEADEGARRRAKLDKDSQFFGAMDGAMKFVKGDSIAGLVIICINLIGGVAVGVTLHGYSFGEAVSIFTLLTVGDGLVAQIPALLMSLCAGVVVTRISNEDSADLGTDIAGELVSDPRVPAIAAVIVLAIGLVPGFPKFVFAGLAVVLLLAAFGLRKSIRAANAKADIEVLDEADEAGAMAQVCDEVDGFDLPISTRFKLRIGHGLAAGIDIADIETTLAKYFQKLYVSRGIAFPRAAIEIIATAPANEVAIELDEVPLWKGAIAENAILVPDNASDDRGGILADVETMPFSSNVLVGVWVSSDLRAKLDDAEVTTMNTEAVLALLAYRLYEHHLGSLFTIEIFRLLMQTLRDAEPVTMPLIETQMEEAPIYKMFRYLIEDGVPFRPASLFTGSLHHWIHSIEEPSSIKLAECLRGSMKRQLCHRIAGEQGLLGLVMLDPEVENLARAGIANMRTSGAITDNDGLSFTAEVSDTLLANFRSLAVATEIGNKEVAIVASADLRRRLRNFLAVNDLHISVLAPHEISNDVRSVPVKLIKLPDSSVGAKTGSRVAAARAKRRASTRPALAS